MSKLRELLGDKTFDALRDAALQAEMLGEPVANLERDDLLVLLSHVGIELQKVQDERRRELRACIRAGVYSP